ncbi:MAG TPA: SpoIID/LytB domain-containing protein [Clostridiales bacterium]|nr:SpoIID/LytB domain-containing protein [Clostridiales bacterium]
MKNNSKNTNYIKIMTLVIIAALFIAASPTGDAAQNIYVNDGNSVLSGSLADAYAIGESGSAAKLGSSKVYALTGSGIELVEGGQFSEPPHLSVSGTVPISRSKIRVGLYYYHSAARDTSLETASLQNYVGSGYKFGYYDSSFEFHEVGYTSETKLTMMKDKNVKVSNGVVGCYHILLPATYSTFDEAKNAASAYADGFPAYYNGEYRVLVGKYKSAAAATADMQNRGISGTVYSASNRCVVVTRTGTTDILFEFDCSTQYPLVIRPRSDSEKAQTWFKSYRYYGDFQYIRTTGENLTVVNILDMEDYVKGVIPYEMSPSWPLEALKAQALCARTYAAKHFNYYEKHGFDVTADTYCQVYRGTSNANATTDKAVDTTAGQYVTYNGELCSTLYFSSDGGATESNENVNGTKVPYLVGVTDPYEQAVADINSYSSWTRILTRDAVTSKLKAYVISTIIDIEPTFSETGNVIALKFTDANGKTVTIHKSQTRTLLGLPSMRYNVSKSGTNYVFEGSGWGHNVGMSQFGANAMAAHYGYTYDQIIGFYYTGVSLSTGVVR